MQRTATRRAHSHDRALTGALTGAATHTDAQSARGLEGDERRRDVVADAVCATSTRARAERSVGQAMPGCVVSTSESMTSNFAVAVGWSASLLRCARASDAE